MMKINLNKLLLPGLLAVAAAYMLLPMRLARTVNNRPFTELTAPADAEAIVPRFLRRMTAEHLQRTNFDATLSPHAWTNFLSTLDAERIYFSPEDIKKLAPYKFRLDSDLNAGNIDFAVEAFNLFNASVSERFTFVTNLLAGEFDLETDLTYEWRRRESPWPTSDEERDTLWRKRIKNEYLRRIVADEFALNDPEDEEAGEDTEDEEVNRILNPQLSPRESIERRYERFMSIMRGNDSEWVLREYLSAVARTFDPHSSYLSRSAVEDFDIEMRLSLVGIGALLRSDEGAAQVVRLIPGGPADQDRRERRLRPGDRIIAVAQDDEEPVDIMHLPLYRVVRLIRGEKGTRVVLTVIPAADPTGSTVKFVDIIRDEVKLEEQAAKAETRTVRDSEGNERKLGIIRLPAFYANLKARADDDDYRSSADDVEAALVELSEKGVEGILLDLRGNGGGSLLEAIRLSGLFIRTGPIVQVKERFRLRVLPDRDPKVAYDGPLVIMVNRLSASASEIVAGALQDYGRAIVVGDSQTHGKGTVQSIVELGRDPAFGSIKVTSAKFYRINGSSTQVRGINADIVLPSPYEYMELGEDSLPNPMQWSSVVRAAYMPWGDLSTVIPALRNQSQQRRKDSERWQSYTMLLNRIETMQTAQSVTLNIQERRELAQAEKELHDMQRRLVEGEEDDNAMDIVRDESLRILADFVHLKELPSSPAVRHPPPERSLSDIISDWIRYNL